MSEARVAILMGSPNDWETMKPAEETLDKLDIASDVRVISAHRTPSRLTDFLAGAEGARSRGGDRRRRRRRAPGRRDRAHTTLPVLGVPIDSSPLQGLDALLATVQMPGGIPVATFAIGKAGAKNAALFARGDHRPQGPRRAEEAGGVPRGAVRPPFPSAPSSAGARAPLAGRSGCRPPLARCASADCVGLLAQESVSWRPGRGRGRP